MNRLLAGKTKKRQHRIVEAIVEKLRNHSKYFEPKTFGIKIPFLKAIVNSLPKETVWSMTVMHRIRSYLAIVTKVHMDNTPRLVNTQTGAFLSYLYIQAFGGNLGTDGEGRQQCEGPPCQMLQ